MSLRSTAAALAAGACIGAAAFLASCATVPPAAQAAEAAGPAAAPAAAAAASPERAPLAADAAVTWADDALAAFQSEVPRAVQKIARKQMEKTARQRGVSLIDMEFYLGMKRESGH
jgi:hypothetical protein